MAARKRRAAPNAASPARPKGKRPAPRSVKAPHKKTRITHTWDADAGVRRCIELMTTGQWVRGRTHFEVADEFGKSPRTAEVWAITAGRIIDVAMGEDRERIRNQMVATLEEVQRRALVNPKKSDLKAAVLATKVKGELLGMVDRGSKVAVQVNVQTYAQLDDASMLEKVDAQIARLTELRMRLAAKQTPAVLTLPAATENDDG